MSKYVILIQKKNLQTFTLSSEKRSWRLKSAFSAKERSSLLYEGTIYNDEVKWVASSFKESDNYKISLLITLTHLVFLP